MQARLYAAVLAIGLSACTGGTTTVTEIQAKRLVCPVEPIVKDCPDFVIPKDVSGKQLVQVLDLIEDARAIHVECQSGVREWYAEHARCVKRIEERD